MKTARIILLSVGATLLVVLLVLRWAVQRDMLLTLPAPIQRTGGPMQPAAGAPPTVPRMTAPTTGQDGRYIWPPPAETPRPVDRVTNPSATNTGPAPVQPPSPPVTPPTATTQPSQLANPIGAAEGAVITGTVFWDGPPPLLKKIDPAKDPRCAELHGDSPLVSQEIVVNPNATLAGVFVYIQKGLGDQKFGPPDAAVVLDQLGCQFVPHVLGIMAGQKLIIRNDDSTLHNAHAMPRNNAEFNVGQPDQGMQSTRKFANPEVMVHMKCDIHPWMSAYIGVLDHPFFSVTGNDGVFTIAGLPPGTYVVAAWQEKYGTQTQTVTVAENETKTIAFTYQP
jgi:hypothetical protein